MENYIQNLFNERNATFVDRQALWDYYNTHLSKAFDVGYNEDSAFYDEELASNLKNNIALFSAFKETSFKTQMEAALTEDGKVVPWSEFKKKAAELNIQYNKQWLKTEYHHTVATANSVDNWKRFEADADLYPNLKYNAVNDARTREAHKVLDGLILPINHEFWKKHNVPLDWGCRCNLEQTDEKPSVTVPDIAIKGIFKNNAALSEKIFGEMPYEKGMNKEEKKEAKENVEIFKAAIPENLKIYEKELGITVNKDIFKHLKKETPLYMVEPAGFRTHQGAYYQSGANFVKIPIDDRRKNSKWYAQAVVHHEFGHAIDFQTNLRNSDRIKALMDESRKMLTTSEMKAIYVKVQTSLRTLTDRDLIEKHAAILDSIASLRPTINMNKTHPDAYWKVKGLKEAEFIAHISENKFSGNDVFKELMPELYKKMVAFEFD